MTTDTHKEVPSADPEAVTEMVEYFLAGIQDYCEKRGKPTTFLDIFMGVHSFHKAVVFWMSGQWEAEGTPPEKTIRTADLMFRKAMRDLRRLTPQKNDLKSKA